MHGYNMTTHSFKRVLLLMIKSACMKEWFSLTLPKYTAVTNIKSNSGKETNQYKTKKP